MKPLRLDGFEVLDVVGPMPRSLVEQVEAHVKSYINAPRRRNRWKNFSHLPSARFHGHTESFNASALKAKSVPALARELERRGVRGLDPLYAQA